LTKCVRSVEGADDTIIDKLIALGVISILDLDDVGVEPLISELNIEAELADKLVKAAVEEAKQLAAETKKKQAENLLQQEEASRESQNHQQE